MKYLIGFAILYLAFRIVRRLLRGLFAAKPTSDKPTPANSTQAEPSSAAPQPTRQRTFDEEFPELCDGTRCSLNDPCREAERLFCGKVMKRLTSASFFSPQFPVCLPSGLRKIDFAFVADGKKIAIEVDGLSHHGKDLTHDQFNDHLRRQNELVIAGWHVLRFSFSQCRKDPGYCVKAIKDLAGHSPRHVEKVRCIYKDIFVPPELFRDAGSTLGPLGAQWTDARNCWYFPADLRIDSKIPEGWRITPWMHCEGDGCLAKAYLDDGSWLCKKCGTKFTFPQN